jgi:pyruvate/2-oxoglutarate/acetoin dehydrogenase E1 component
MAEVRGIRLKAARRVAARETPIPASKPLEEATLPGVDEIIKETLTLIRLS